MPVVTCKLGLFDYDQGVYLINDDGTSREIGRAPFESLPNLIAATCYEYDANEVILYGSKYYTKQLARLINTKGADKYSKNIAVIERESN